MAQAGYTPISLYYSTTASAVPTSGNLANGELGLNIADMKLYAKNSAGVVTLLASNAATTGVDSLSFGSTGLTPSTATTGAITVAGTLNVANGGTGLTTLTANRIPYGNGTSAFQSSANLTFDGTSLAVTGKININSPSSTSGAINVKSADANLADFVGSDGALGVFIANASGVPQVGSRGGDQGLNIAAGGSTAPARIAFITATTEKMRIDYLGNVGIGTSSPATKLEVSNGAITAGSGGDVLVGRFSSTFPSPATGYFKLRTNNTDGSNGGISIDTLTADVLTEKVRVDRDGVVLIGATSVSGVGEKLNVTGFGILTQSSAGTNRGLYGTFGGATIIAGSFDSIPLEIRTGNSTRFQVGTAGQFGIGGATYGTAGQVLTSGGSGAAPTWAAAGGGSQAFVAFGSTGGL